MTYPTRNNKERFDREVEIELTESEATRMKELHEHSTRLGKTGLSYGTRAAEEMIAERTRKLEARGYPDAERAAIGQLAAEGNLRTEREVSVRDIYLGDPARRELAAEKRQQARRGQDDLDAAKREAKRREITLGEVMNERAMSGEVRL